MPTLKPRITTTLEESTFQVIDRMAQLQGVSRGAVVSDLLNSVAVPLARTVALLEAARDAPEQVRAGLADVVTGVHDDLLDKAGDSIKQLDMLLGKMGPTPPSNTGVRSL